MGEDQSKYGIGFQLLWNKSDNDTVIPMYTNVKPHEMIPVYNYDIGQVMVAGIRYYKMGDVVNVDVYYANYIEFFTLDKDKKLVISASTSMQVCGT